MQQDINLDILDEARKSLFQFAITKHTERIQHGDVQNSTQGSRVVPVPEKESSVREEIVSEQSSVNYSTQGLQYSYNELVEGSIPPIKTKGIKCGHLNIHSLVSKIDELRLLLKHRPFDVICLNETLCDSSISDEELLITSPTRVTSHSNTLIDLIFVNNPDVFTDNGVFCTSISDHFLTYSVRCFNFKSSTQQGHNYIEYRPFKKMIVQDFIHDLENVPWNAIVNITDIELAWQTWLNSFMEIVNLHAPLCKKKIRQNACPWITDDIVKLMKERDQIHKAAVKHNCQNLWNEYRCLRNKVTHMMQKQKTDHYCGLIRDNAGNSKKIWSCLKEVTPKQGRILPSSIEVNGSDCSDSDQIANAFNDYFVTCAQNVTKDLPVTTPTVFTDVSGGKILERAVCDQLYASDRDTNFVYRGVKLP
ncbi:uncharacterized protein LOC119721478 [Patiria miniata]|uniref:Endonuclease/exonuclease/phosphatase domain-containing protein n=1 Tax=Patiria miniata TaxID=46514 RepID=A0A913Z6Y7_PATMI|nr:uncharacterized protein LOC119721478 [Patiria miniata]